MQSIPVPHHDETNEPLPVLVAYVPVTHVIYAEDNYLLHAGGWKRFRNLDNLSSLTSPKGEMKRSFSWTNLFKSPTSSTICLGEPTLGKLNQIKLLCSPTASLLCDPTLAKLIKKLSFVSPSTFLCDSVVHTGTTLPVQYLLL